MVRSRGKPITHQVASGATCLRIPSASPVDIAWISSAAIALFCSILIEIASVPVPPLQNLRWAATSSNDEHPPTTKEPAMVKAIYLIKRKRGLELEAFRKYWLTTHAGLALKVPGLRKYVQSHTIESGYKKGEPVFDGIAEVWYDDTNAMRRIAELPQARAVNDDGHNFMDMRASGLLLTREHVVKDGPIDSSMVKYVAFAKR